MSRGLKQLGYGVLYLAVIAAIGFGVYVRYVRQAPSCFDHIQNQGEQGIDCGPVCGNICMDALRPIEVGNAPSPMFFENAPGRATVLALLVNPNADFGATKVSYEFSFYDASHTLVASVPTETFIYPGERRYVALVNAAIPVVADSMGVTIATNTAWAASSSMGLPPNLVFENQTVSSVASGTVMVNATLANQENFSFSNIAVVAIFHAPSGAVVGVSNTVVDRVDAAGSVPVSLSYPTNVPIDASATELYAYAPR